MTRAVGYVEGGITFTDGSTVRFLIGPDGTARWGGLNGQGYPSKEVVADSVEPTEAMANALAEGCMFSDGTEVMEDDAVRPSADIESDPGITIPTDAELDAARAAVRQAVQDIAALFEVDEEHAGRAPRPHLLKPGMHPWSPSQLDADGYGRSDRTEPQ